MQAGCSCRSGVHRSCKGESMQRREHIRTSILEHAKERACSSYWSMQRIEHIRTSILDQHIGACSL